MALQPGGFKMGSEAAAAQTRVNMLTTIARSNDFGAGYDQIETSRIDGNMITAWSSCAVEDGGWDAFLRKVSNGHFQQSSLWSQVKALERWSSSRIVLTLGDTIVGGFQILSRQSRLGRIGYVTKGPVFALEHPDLAEFGIELLRRMAKTYNMVAVIVQPPDNSNIVPHFSDRHQFVPNVVLGMIEATLIIDLSATMEQINQEMSRYTRKQVRQAKQRGISIREGGAGDISTFFQLMLATCKRQGDAKPNPSTESVMKGMWSIFHPHGCARLTIAQCGEEIVSAQWSIPFGERVTLWKKGWSSAHSNRHPNQLLTYEAIEWAQSKGYKLLDFSGLAPSIAAALLRKERLSEQQKASRDAFHLGFGGRPLLLPKAFLLINNPIIRVCYRAIVSHTLVKAIVRRLFN